jgi:hypothetical protein
MVKQIICSMKVKRASHARYDKTDFKLIMTRKSEIKLLSVVVAAVKVLYIIFIHLVLMPVNSSIIVPQKCVVISNRYGNEMVRVTIADRIHYTVF